MFRHLSKPAVLVASAILSAVGCQACSSCYDYSSPVADCQCGCGCQRAGSVHCDCNSGDGTSGGCTTGNGSASGEGTSGPVMMEEGPVQQGPMPQSMAPSGGSMNHTPAFPQ